ncbi:hypothetical protein Nepgr_031027 [Nepenthes gracilis]|uniref:Phosphate transporter PHO1 n=1 Tax=Nepenthes gracilis TaxID=150966 RepID=A0AAD3THA6_NEPGR|nr:hypothetical protein Nepgr_031027 [Nepenthes gracilis]
MIRYAGIELLSIIRIGLHNPMAVTRHWFSKFNLNFCIKGSKKKEPENQTASTHHSTAKQMKYQQRMKEECDLLEKRMAYNNLSIEDQNNIRRSLEILPLEDTICIRSRLKNFEIGKVHETLGIVITILISSFLPLFSDLPLALRSRKSMVKFSKELESQLIPEWKEAFVNYWQLKKHIKKIRLSRKSKQSPSHTPFHYFVSSITHPIRRFSDTLSATFSNSAYDTDHQLKSKPAPREEEEGEEPYESERLQLSFEEDEVKRFFATLEDELDKVNLFYKSRETEFLERGEVLNKQLQILLDMKRFLNDHKKILLRRLDMATSTHFISAVDRIPEYSDTAQTGEVIAELEKNGVNFIFTASNRWNSTKKGKSKAAVNVDIQAITPARSISAAMSGIWEDLVFSFTKKDSGDLEGFVDRKKIQCAEKMVRGAFVEFHRGLGLLKTYRSLNMVAFRKILKKFDKVVNRQASADYLEQVKGAHFITSELVARLMDEVESSFTKNFTDDDRKKAMKFLCPQQHKESHLLTFFVGLFTGCFFTLFILYAILAHLGGIFSPRRPKTYMETVYPIFSMFALMSLHLFMYGCNLLMWKATRINYNFILEFCPKTSLNSRDAFLISTCFMTAVVAVMILHLILTSNGFPPTQVDALPTILLLIFGGLLICPINIFYRQTRYFFLWVIRNVVCSPFYKVVIVDFFMADQLTSQIQLLRHLETTTCYFLAGSFKTREYETCESGRLYRQLAYVVSFAPYYWRAMQTFVSDFKCARRWFDESDPNHLANLGKYLSAMVAAGVRLTYARRPTNLWMILVVVTSAAATVYQLYWDFVKDWGFLNPNSKNPWLRDDLILKNKCIYYISIAVNVVLRVVWVETVMRFNVGMFESRLLDFSLASLEVIRRGHWNFYRLENEHLNNAGKFRAVKTVPLPFHEIDLEG